MIKWIARLLRAWTGRKPETLAEKAKHQLKTRLPPHLMKDIGLRD